MTCREFRRKHAAYIDDTLSGVELEEMARHRRLCERCSQLDTRIRRALLVARNLPMIYPSAAFADRLQARLRAERISVELMRQQTESVMSARRWPPLSAGAYAVIAAGILAAAGMVAVVSLADMRNEVIRLAPVVASRPESEPSALMTPTMVAAMPAGIPLWPAVFVAQQAPWHLVSDGAGH